MASKPFDVVENHLKFAGVYGRSKLPC